MSPLITSLFDLSGKSALITGASGSLGAAAARALAGAGAHVTLAGSNENAIAALGEEICLSGGAASTVIGRPESEEECARLVAATRSEGRALDILVSAGGTSKIKRALDMTANEWDAVMEGNVRQSWLISRAAGKAMIEQASGGKVILVSSIRGRFATAAGTSAYGPSKAAVDMLVRSFATEWGESGINVNAIAPTIFRSELTAWLFEEGGEAQRRNVLSRVPIGRLSEPDDLAGALVFLASKASDYVTGEILHVDGGFAAN